MMTGNTHSVSVELAVARPFAAVRARIAIRSVPAMFAQHLDQVYAAGRDGAVALDGQNIFVYRNPDFGDVADIEFGVGIKAPFESRGNVVASMTPSGEAAVTTHWGSYSGLREAHQAVIDWAKRNGRRLMGTRWEVYGHWTPDESQLRTDVHHLVEPR